MPSNARRLYEAMIRVKKLTLKVGVRVITHNEQLALDELISGKEQKLTITELSQRFNASMPATSRLVKQLEEKGLATRETDTDDRRYTYVIPTEKGRISYKRNSELLSGLLERATKDFSDEEITSFLDFFDKIYECTYAEMQALDQDGED